MHSSSMQNAPKAAVVIVAAGRGERAGKADGPKQYRPIGGRPVVAHTLEAFLAHPRIGRIVVAIHPDDQELFAAAATGFDSSRILAIPGGSTRQDSTRLALLALREDAPEMVLIHDGVRPFVDAALIDRTIEAIDVRQGALPSMQVAETLKRMDGEGNVSETVPRAGLYAAQTPQGFPYLPILAAHEKAFELGKHDFTDDAAVAEWAKIPVRIVTGSPDNVKLTWARDMVLADQRFATRPAFPDVRTGNGYDVHSFEEGDHVVLCGVQIPHTKKLSGHSDADVALHALTDALLATCGEGDIGTHFPPSDPQWKGAASSIFLEHAASIVRSHGGRIANVDITLICEAPRIGPHRETMTARIADIVGVSATRISVKATTNEKLGFVGREEGIAAIATASVVYPGEIPE
ncbi:MAG: bifunctional 2-C-methyl-D-erythritol 4-phosphate cytidylyltransferase/2-C-methyl-D-erythritol 2,4-cyclodiphosphate synthase [Rhizobiaceae bacterium]|nr:bifunctional 2-C-methyl-D-erythritol 4-phosphate cytidylyltransferase/2-C-methyl-D-erythritol 2,4-cyclodiphosphate synthase [Rhizobiaceae bacterium]